ncbi:MAG: endonuclease/exonuclease/phosphatase (EEP) superfamily protein YafD [Moritella sp.]|jgi:endonuclease/exonuclease/phosphatase (EEP) superfamily protein YafD
MGKINIIDGKCRYPLMIRAAFYLINVIVFTLILIPALSPRISLWWLDNLINLQLQWSFFAILLVLINIKYIQQYVIPLSIVYFLIIAYNQVPLYLSNKSPLQDREILTIAQLNIRYKNPNIDELIFKISTSAYDVIVLQEVADYQHEEIKKLTRYYPYSIGIKPLESSPSGLALFSKWPIVNKKIHDMGHTKGHFIEAIIQTPKTSTPVQIYALHPSSPRTEKLWQLRNATLDYVAHQVASSFLQYKIVIGDINTTPWSTEFKYLEKISSLTNTAAGFGYIPSWSYSNRNNLIRVLSSAYIDHCLVSNSFNVIKKEYQVVKGTDHVLIFTKLGIE